MQDIYLKRNELCKNSIKLRSVKFDENIKREDTFKLNKVQNEVYKKYIFYNEYIKAMQKEDKEEKKK